MYSFSYSSTELKKGNGKFKLYKKPVGLMPSMGAAILLDSWLVCSAGCHDRRDVASFSKWLKKKKFLWKTVVCAILMYGTHI